MKTPIMKLSYQARGRHPCRTYFLELCVGMSCPCTHGRVSVQNKEEQASEMTAKNTNKSKGKWQTYKVVIDSLPYFILITIYQLPSKLLYVVFFPSVYLILLPLNEITVI